MRTISTSIFKLSCLLFLVFVIASCEKEKIAGTVTEDTASETTFSETLPFEEFKKSEVYANFETQIGNGSNPLLGASSSPCGGMQIVYVPYGEVFELEIPGISELKTYTVGVVPIDEEIYNPNYFENLVIMESPQSSAAFIVKYKRKTRKQGNRSTLGGGMEELPAEVAGITSLYGTSGVPCGGSVTTITPCTCEGHFPGQECICGDNGTKGSPPSIVTEYFPPCDVTTGPCITFGTGGGQEGGIEGGPGSTGGGSVPPPTTYIGGNYPVDGDPNDPNRPWYSPVLEVPVIDVKTLPEYAETLVDILNLSGEAAAWADDIENLPEVIQIYNFLNQHKENGNYDSAAKDFAFEAMIYLIAHPDVSFDDLLNNKSELNDETGDYNNNTIGGYDTTSYNPFNPAQESWPTITNVISENDFVGYRTELRSDGSGSYLHCMDFAKEQIAVSGYQISNYFNNAGQTIQIYTEQNGTDQTALTEGLSYLKYALENNIPVIVGVDVKSGSPNGPTDNTTDHFIVVVGMGSDPDGNYFIFYDNATAHKSEGTHPHNKLYYDETNAIITGHSQTWYADRPGNHDYIVTQIRKSKLK